jgi:methionyl-tRNA formyltransferase
MVQSQHLKSHHTQLLAWVCNLNLIVASSSPLAKPLVSLLQQSKKHKLLAIITNPDKPIGRGQKIEPNSLAAWANDEKIKTYKPSNDSELLNLINELSPQLVITIAFGKIIPEQLLSIPEFGWINVHFSILPKWRGAAPVQWAILSGEKTSGIR